MGYMRFEPRPLHIIMHGPTNWGHFQINSIKDLHASSSWRVYWLKRDSIGIYRSQMCYSTVLTIVYNTHPLKKIHNKVSLICKCHPFYNFFMLNLTNIQVLWSNNFISLLTRLLTRAIAQVVPSWIWTNKSPHY